MKRIIVAGLAATGMLTGGAIALQQSGINVAEARQKPESSKAIVDAAKARGEIGERIDGYLAAVTTLAPNVRAAMDDINIRRKYHYEQLADEKGVRIAVIAQLAGEKQIRDAAPGAYVMGENGKWERK